MRETAARSCLAGSDPRRAERWEHRPGDLPRRCRFGCRGPRAPPPDYEGKCVRAAGDCVVVHPKHRVGPPPEDVLSFDKPDLRLGTDHAAEKSGGNCPAHSSCVSAERIAEGRDRSDKSRCSGVVPYRGAQVLYESVSVVSATNVFGQRIRWSSSFAIASGRRCNRTSSNSNALGATRPGAPRALARECPSQRRTHRIERASLPTEKPPNAHGSATTARALRRDRDYRPKRPSGRSVGETEPGMVRIPHVLPGAVWWPWPGS